MQVTLSGLATGSVYALFLLGILIVFRVSKAVNFSQGQLGMIAAYLAFSLYSSRGLPVWLSLLLGLCTVVVISFATERFFLERISRRARMDGQDLVLTLGALLLLTALAENMFGSQTKSFLSLGTDRPFRFGGVVVNLNQVVVFVLTLLVLGGFAWFLRTGPGVGMRASAADADLAKSFGLNVTRIRGVTWAVSGLIAGVTGIIIASRLSVDPYYMTPFLIKAFIAGIIGGLDRFAVPLLVAFGLAFYEGWSNFLFGSSVGTASVFILVIVLLTVLPKRFLDERQEARA